MRRVIQAPADLHAASLSQLATSNREQLVQSSLANPCATPRCLHCYEQTQDNDSADLLLASLSQKKTNATNATSDTSLANVE
jgi:hypothetical protein